MVPSPPRSSPAKIPIFDLHLDLLYHAVQVSGDFSQSLKLFPNLKGLVANYYFEGGNKKEELVRVLDFIKKMKIPKEPAIVLGLEGLAPLSCLTEIEQIYQAGIRQVSLTWNDVNALGAGCLHQGGLTELGRQVAGRFSQLGGVIDVSHGSAQLINDLLDLNLPRLIASHVGAKAIYDHPRNLADEVIKRIAVGGGFIGLAPAFFIGAPDNRSIEQFMRHVRHVVNLVGIEHVAISSDFLFFLPDYQSSSVPWFTSEPDYQVLTEALVRLYGPDGAQALLFDNYYSKLVGWGIIKERPR